MTDTSVSYQVRAIEPGEWPALAHMYETFEPKRASFGVPPVSHPEDWLAEIAATCQSLVVISNGQIVGHGMICKSGRDAEFALYIHQDFRGRGLGRKLLEALIAEARRLNVHVLWGVEEAENDPLFHLTEELGFGGGAHEGMIFLRLAEDERGDRVVDSLRERRIKDRRHAA